MPYQMSARRRRPVQLELARTRGWGGKRRGAGRKPAGEKPGVRHRSRPALASRFPVHVTLRVLPHVWNLRSRRSFRVIRRSLAAASDRFGMRVCEFSVQGNHLHLLLEAQEARALSRGMQGLSIRLARGLNALMGRAGKVLADRFHAHILRTPSEVRNALRYVRGNRASHLRRLGESVVGDFVDAYSSAAPEHGIPLGSPHTYLLLQARAVLERATVASRAGPA